SFAVREAPARNRQRRHLRLQRGNEFHLAHSERLQQHAFLLRVDRRQLPQGLGAEPVERDGRQEGRPLHHVRRGLPQSTARLLGLQRPERQVGLQVHGLVQSLFTDQTHRGRMGGRVTDGNGAGIASARVDLEWSWDNVTWSPESQIGHFTTQSDGTYGADMVFHGTTPHTEYIRSQFAGDSTYQASTSPVVAQSI